MDGVDKYGKQLGPGQRQAPPPPMPYDNNPRGLNFVKDVRTNPNIPTRKELANRYQMPGA